MKKIILMLTAVMITSLLGAQKIKEAEVPSAVKSAFQKLYPKATEVKWEKEKGNYEAEFDLDEVDHSVLFDDKGGVLETEVEINPNQLPAAALEYLKTNYKGKKVKEASRIMDAQGSITYEAEIKGKDIIFDSEGKFIKESKD